MTCISFKQIHEGRSASDSADDKGKYTVTTTQVWRAETDCNTDTEYDIALHPDCPSIGAELIKTVVIDEEPTTVYTGQYLKSRSFSNQMFSKRVWHVTLTYSSDNIEINSSDPLQTEAVITWRSEQFQKPALIVNSSGDPYDPPIEIDDSRIIATVVKNVAQTPLWLMDYRDAVNSVPFNLDGLVIGERQAKLQDVQISGWMSQNRISYRQIQMSIALSDDTFDIQALDAGFNQLNYTNAALVHTYTDLHLTGSFYITSSDRLFVEGDLGYVLSITDGQGFAKGDYTIMWVGGGEAALSAIAGVPGSTKGQGTLYNNAYTREKILIRDSEGELVEPTSPILLDGGGRPIPNPSAGNAVYNRHREYKERDFNLLPLV